MTGTPGQDGERFDDFLRRLAEAPQSDLDALLGEHPEHEERIGADLRDCLRAPDEVDPLSPGAPSSFDRDSVRAGEALGPYEVLQPLGSGGMGRVFLARHASLRRTVALKVLHPHLLDERSRERFRREARASARLAHSGIVTVYEHGESDGIPWIALELVPGGRTLRDAVLETAREGQLPGDYYATVARLAQQLVEALAFAHERGVIHRDLKPQNVLLTTDGQPKIADFGLARIADEAALSRTGEVVGTYSYMSPEQLTPGLSDVDHRTDVFSLGVLLYELLTLRRPFVGDTFHQVAFTILHQEPTDPRKLRSQVPVDLAVICLRCLEKEPARRYPHMRAVAEDLARHRASRPILARPAGTGERARKWLRRHPVLSAAAFLSTAATVTIAVLLVANVRANHELERRNRALEESARSLAEKTREAESEAAAVKRLAAVQRLDDLLAEAEDLWPPHPERIPALEDWQARAEELVAELPEHRARLAELAVTARPRTDAELARDSVMHPDYPELQRLRAEFAARDAALATRSGGPPPVLPAVPLEGYPENVLQLNALVRDMLGSDAQRFGREAEALVLAERAVARAATTSEANFPDLESIALDTLARVNVRLGRDAEAIEASARALALSPDAFAEHFQERWRDWNALVTEAMSPNGIARAEAELEELQVRIAELERRVEAPLEPRFDDETTRWWHHQLSRLVTSIEDLREPERGLLCGTRAAVCEASIVQRLELSRALSAGHARGGPYHARWRGFLAELADDPRYRTLALEEQVGLVPIGRDPESGLAEFWHVLSGEEPERGADGRIALRGGDGVVLVLVPAAVYWMGGQFLDPERRNHDIFGELSEGPAHEVALDAYLLSKYELTQAQWKRLTGENPSLYGAAGTWSPGWAPTGSARLDVLPVERVGWEECRRTLGRVGLRLPTEAQWEHAARGGTDGSWWTGSFPESVSGAANLRDSYGRGHGWDGWDSYERWLDDGYSVEAPVDTLRPNPFGLFHVMGNVWEWCEDGYGPYPNYAVTNPTGNAASPTRVLRGGAYDRPAREARSRYREYRVPDTHSEDTGVRPARAIDR